MKKPSISLGCAVFLAVAIGHSKEKPDVHGAEVLGFAESLFQEADYYRAITEYKRILFQEPQGMKKSWVQFRIGQSYLLGGKFEAAWLVFDDIVNQENDPLTKQWAGLTSARLWMLQERYEQALSALKNLDHVLQEESLRLKARYLKACNLVHLGRLTQAHLVLHEIDQNSPLANPAQRLQERLKEYELRPTKNPMLAGILSVVPGLGHFYLEEFSVGLTALAWNGLFGFATVHAFQKQQIGVGSLLAVLELLWYSGTMFGAISGAHRFNRDVERNFIEGLTREELLDIAFPEAETVRAFLRQKVD